MSHFLHHDAAVRWKYKPNESKQPFLNPLLFPVPPPPPPPPLQRFSCTLWLWGRAVRERAWNSFNIIHNNKPNRDTVGCVLNDYPTLFFACMCYTWATDTRAVSARAKRHRKHLKSHGWVNQLWTQMFLPQQQHSHTVSVNYTSEINCKFWSFW